LGLYGAGGGLVLGLIAGLVMLISIRSSQLADTSDTKDRNSKPHRARVGTPKVTGSPGCTSIAPSTENPPAVDPYPDAVGRNRPCRQTKPPETSQLRPGPNLRPAVPRHRFKNLEVRDINGDGVPDLWIYYNPQKPGEINASGKKLPRATAESTPELLQRRQTGARG